MNATADTNWTTGDQAIYAGRKVTLGSFPTSANHRPRALGHACHLGDDCRRFDIVGNPNIVDQTAWECCLYPVPDTTCDACGKPCYDHTGHAAVWRAGNHTIGNAACGQALRRKIRAARRAKMTPIVKQTATTLLVSRPGTPYRSECWSATSKDGVWRYDREDEPTTPWYVKHIPTGRVADVTYGTLDAARYATGTGAIFEHLPELATAAT
jgi:hypothetical protein